MIIQLIDTKAGWSAALWENRMLSGITLPYPDEESAISTLSGYLKMNLKGVPFIIESLDSNQLNLSSKFTSYFAGERVDFDIPLNWDVVTGFQKRVLQKVYEIPYGSTVSYGEIARQIGNPKAARAVGGAVGSNPWLLLVPCHRVLAANRGLGGFGCGLEWKIKLLELENIL